MGLRYASCYGRKKLEPRLSTENVVPTTEYMLNPKCKTATDYEIYTERSFDYSVCPRDTFTRSVQ